MALTSTPRLLKGALVTVELATLAQTVIVFQYNPGTLTRTLQPKTAGEGASRTDVPRLRGAPTETLSLEIELDIADALEKGDTRALELGLHAQLAALERLLYPPSQAVIANQALL